MADAPSTLVQRAFDVARASGKPNWHRMTIPVLKNRILMLTRREFKESDYGAANFYEFVQRASDIVKLDDSQVPQVVELRNVPPREPVAASPIRIRPDLWRAVMDYASGNKYVWDTATGLARPLEAGDVGTTLLPTITSEIHKAWRREFADAHSASVGEAEKARLNTWVQNSLSPKALPYDFMHAWNLELQKRVRDVLDGWFQTNEISPPEKIAVAPLRAPRIGGPESLEDLRTFVMTCVRMMNEQELAELKLPASAVFRATKN